MTEKPKVKPITIETIIVNCRDNNEHFEVTVSDDKTSEQACPIVDSTHYCDFINKGAVYIGRTKETGVVVHYFGCLKEYVRNRREGDK